VQLGIFVNFVFVMFTLVSSSAGERAAERWNPAFTGVGVTSLPPPPPPTSASPRQSRAFTFDEDGRTKVSLYYDLTLVKRPGFQLTLSPSFSMRKNPPMELSNFSLRFMRFSDDKDRGCLDDCRLAISADGERVWPRGEGKRTPPQPQWEREVVPHTSTMTSDGRALETTAGDILTTHVPYDVFTEIITAGRVTVTLGADTVVLTTEQTEALRDMYRKLAESKPDAVIINAH
jgi:hypothetical protein